MRCFFLIMITLCCLYSTSAQVAPGQFPMKAQWGAIKDSVATVGEIIANSRMLALIPGCRCFSKHAIGSFRINFISNNIRGADSKLFIAGNSLDQKAIAVIKQLRAKDKIVFDNIITTDIDSRAKQLPSFSITIK
jgi:hypothetical protein